MDNKRLKILSRSEVNELYNVPQFSANEQKNYFSLNKKEYKIMSERGSLASKVHFILHLGYFKAASQFFNFKFKDAKRDVNFILQQYFDNATLSSNSISQKTCQSNQQLIAELLGFLIDKTAARTRLVKMLKTKSRLCSNPIYIFHESLSFSAENKMILLTYSTMQDLIGAAITAEEERLSRSLKKYLPNDKMKLIENTLCKTDNEYVLTALKKDPKSFKKTEIKAEIKKLTDHEVLYRTSIAVLPKLNITNQNIQYYANLTEHYPISNLKKLSRTKQAIYVLCYANHRHQKINDHLAISFIHYIEKFKSEAAASARDNIYDQKLEINADTNAARHGEAKPRARSLR